MNKHHILAFMYMGLAYAILRLVPGVLSPDSGQSNPPDPIDLTLVDPAPVIETPADAAYSWFVAMRPYCNAVEVETRVERTPAPDVREGASYSAACFALAGKIDRAREIILALSPDDRWQAAGVVFGVAHPVADAGDDVAAGPVMELVVEFWPNHYQALYHAGAARFQVEDYGPAYDYLTRFLRNYDVDDGWTASARKMLASMPHGC